MSKRKKDEDYQTKPKQRKFNEEQSLNKSQIQFTLNEKRCFLKACQENGLNVIYNTDKLKEYLPERNETEINFLIASFERKSKCRKEDNESSKDTPLESWYKLCDSLVRPHLKKDDYSTLLIDLIKIYSEKNGKYSNVYRFLKELIEGRYPSKLNLNDSIIFLSLINNLKHFIENQDLSNEKDYLLNKFKQLTEQVKANKEDQQNRVPESDNNLEFLNYFEQIDPSKLKCDIQKATAELNNRSGDKLVNFNTDKEINEDNDSNEVIKASHSTVIQQKTVQQTAQQTAQQATTQSVLTNSSSSSPSSINSNLNDSRASKFLKKEDNPYYYYSQLPRIRLIKETLNPLDISIDTICDLHSYVTLDRLVNESSN